MATRPLDQRVQLLGSAPHMAPISQTLRPLGLGELMDRSLRVWRGNLLPLARVMLPYAVLSRVLISVGMQQVGAQQQQMLAEPDNILIAGRVMGSMFGMMGIAFWLAWLGYFELSWRAYPLFTGQPPPLTRGFLRRQLTATMSFVALVVFTFTVCVVAMLPVMLLVGGIAYAVQQQATSPMPMVLTVLIGGGVALLVFTLVMLWLTLRCYFAAPVLAVETPSLRVAWRRCRELIGGRIGPGFFGRVPVRASILITVVAAVVFSIQGIASFPMLGLQMAFSDSLANLSVDAVPLYLRVPAEALVVAVSAVSSPIYALFGMRFYLDQRVRREALDLELALEQQAA